MNKLLTIILIAIFMSGCSLMSSKQPPLSIHIKKEVVMPSEAQFRCPELPIVTADIDNLTDTEVADYLLQLYEAGSICKDSLEGVRQFLIDAQRGIDEVQPD